MINSGRRYLLCFHAPFSFKNVFFNLVLISDTSMIKLSEHFGEVPCLMLILHGEFHLSDIHLQAYLSRIILISDKSNLSTPVHTHNFLAGFLVYFQTLRNWL